MLPRKKNQNLGSLDCGKCTEIVNPAITTLFCIILNLLRSHQADLLCSWGVRTPAQFSKSVLLPDQAHSRPQSSSLLRMSGFSVEEKPADAVKRGLWGREWNRRGWHWVSTSCSWKYTVSQHRCPLLYHNAGAHFLWFESCTNDLWLFL